MRGVRSTGYERDMSEQHIPLAKPSTHGRFKRFTGYVGGFLSRTEGEFYSDESRN